MKRHFRINSSSASHKIIPFERVDWIEFLDTGIAIYIGGKWKIEIVKRDIANNFVREYQAWLEG